MSGCSSLLAYKLRLIYGLCYQHDFNLVQAVIACIGCVCWSALHCVCLLSDGYRLAVYYTNYSRFRDLDQAVESQLFSATD